MTSVGGVMAPASTTPRVKAKRTTRGSAHQDTPTNYWKGNAPDLILGRDRFRVSALRGGRGKPSVYLDPILESFSWTDASAVLEGAMQLRVDRGRVDLTSDDRVRCEVSRDGKHWSELWTLRIQTPTTDLGVGGRSFTLADELDILRRSKDDFVFKKDKRHPKGWFVHEAVASVAHRYDMKVVMPRTRHRVTKLIERNASPLDVIVKLLRMEKSITGLAYVLAYRGGKLTVTKRRRSKDMLILAKVIEQGTLEEALREDFATIITARGKVKGGTSEDSADQTKSGRKSGKARTIKVTVQSKAGLARFGRIHRFIESNGKTEDAVRHDARVALQRSAKPQRSLSVRLGGIPTLRRGAACQVVSEVDDLKVIVFASSIAHDVSSAGHTMTVTLGFDDPIAAVEDAQDKAAKKRAAAAKKRKRTTKATAKATPKPKPRRAASHTDVGGVAA